MITTYASEWLSVFGLNYEESTLLGYLLMTVFLICLFLFVRRYMRETTKEQYKLPNDYFPQKKKRLF